MKTLVIAEKPDMGRTIAAVIEPGAARRRGWLEGRQYIITWAIGHLVSLAEPEQYDARYKHWRDADLPILPVTFKLQPNPRTADQLRIIGELAQRCSRIVNACDAGREGQLIFHFIREYLRLDQPVDRLWISDLTPETIRRGFAELKSDREYDALTRAARARSQADWLIGMNASRAFTIRHRTLLSAGRVQTPVLALLYERHKEIEAFRPETYYAIHGIFRAGNTVYRGIRQGDKVTSREAAEAIAAAAAGQTGAITEYEVVERKEYPPRLYDLTLLQREANAKFGFSAKKTLDLAQSLYERHQLITYPRTSSNYVTEENIPFMHKALAMLRDTGLYREAAAGADAGRVHRGNKAVCNPQKVDDHHAILPTPKRPGRSKRLSADEERIYDLIVRRFLSHFYPPAVYRVHEILTEIAGETFRTKIKELLDPGWTAVMEADRSQGAALTTDSSDGTGENARGKDRNSSRSARTRDGAEEDETVLIHGGFLLDPAMPAHCESVDIAEKTTQPPKPYTEGTLLRAMESAGRSVEDEELREAMKETGLGTPATRAATIERLKQVGYAALKGRRLEITPKGIAAIELIRGAGVELLTSPEMTGRWEQRLLQIARGEASDEPFMDQVRRFAAKVVELARRQRPMPPGSFGEQPRRGRSGKPERQSTRRKFGDTQTALPDSGGFARTETGRSSAARRKGSDGPGACPRPGCGGRLIEGKRGFGCSRYREGCRFVIWKHYRGRTITAAMAAALAAKGKTRPVLLQGDNGDKVKGRLILADPHTGELQAVFE